MTAVLKVFYCPDHGFLCETTANATITCGSKVTKAGASRRCNKKGIFGKEIAKKFRGTRSS